MEDDNVLAVDNDDCPVPSLMELAHDLGHLIEYLQHVNESSHRHRYLSLAVTDLQSAENWLNRWFDDMISDEELEAEA